MDYKSCFILMPFSKAGSLNEEDLDYIYSHIIKRAVEEYHYNNVKYFERVERFKDKVGSIISGIVNNLNTADLVIADLTGLNPNVMYELGVRHSLRKGTIIISQDIKNLPSDLRDYLTVSYNYSQKTTDQVKNYDAFKTALHTTIDETITTQKFDSPVLSYLNQKQRFKNEDEVSRLKENVVIIDAIHTEFTEVQSLVLNLPDYISKNTNPNLVYNLFNLKLSNLSLALNELRIPFHSSILYENVANGRTMINEVAKTFNISEYFFSVLEIPDFPKDFMGATDLAGCLQKKYVNLFALTDKNVLEYASITDLFKKDGILDSEFLTYLTEYLDNKAIELEVDGKELEKLLIS